MKRQSSQKLFKARTCRIADLISQEVHYALCDAAMRSDGVRGGLKERHDMVLIRSCVRDRFETPLVMREIRRLLRGT